MFKYLVMASMVLGLSVAQAKEEKKVERVPASESLVARPCDDKTPTNLDYFVEKKSYANESIRVFSVDTYGEPACCSSHLVIYMPEKDQPMASKCFHIATTSDGLGFNGINMSKAKSSYNSKSGLSLNVPVLFYNPETGGTKQKPFTILINQATQSVQIK
jgi:hypothetical protein